MSYKSDIGFGVVDILSLKGYPVAKALWASAIGKKGKALLKRELQQRSKDDPASATAPSPLAGA